MRSNNAALPTRLPTTPANSPGSRNKMISPGTYRLTTRWLLAVLVLCMLHATPVQAADEAQPLPALTAERQAELMEQARQAMAAQKYDDAIRIYTRLTEEPAPEIHQQALEYLGVARERNGQVAHAKALYEDYLQRYPKDDGAKRVSQRLAGLTTAREEPPDELRRGKSRNALAHWDSHAGISQYYRRDVSSTDAGGDTVDRSSLDTGIDVTSRLRGADFDLGARFSGNNEYDFLAAGDHQTRISSLYIDGATSQRLLSGRLGRQTSTRGGVLGRFDGLFAGYQLTPTSRLNIVTGYPVETTTATAIDTARPFYGLNVDLGAPGSAWELNVYTIEQRVGAITDRQAVGGEMRYFQASRSMFAMLDYDTLFNDVDLALLTGNWLLPGNSNLSIVADHRRSPLLMTSNALIGQTATSIDELRLSNSDDAIQQLAQDRTATSDSLMLGLSRPVSARLQLSGDVTVSSLSGTPASGGVAANDDTGNDYYYSVQLVGNDLLKQGDTAIVGLRFADTSSAATTSLMLNTRYPLGDAWRVNPRLRVDHREFSLAAGDQWTAAPSIRVNYRWRKRYFFEIESGGEWSSRRLSNTTDRTTSSYLSLGYRADF